MMAPTAAMALNCALAATYAGPAVPLAFVLAFVTIAGIAFAFVTFARTYATPASVGEFNARGLGPFWGRLSLWVLLLAYVLFTAGSAAECGAFAAAAFAYGSIAIAWWPAALLALAGCAYVGTRSARTSARPLLVCEGASVAAIVVLCGAIFARGGATGFSPQPFMPSPSHLSGLGLGTVFALLSFAGFEGAAVLGAESRDPTSTIPRAIVASVVASGVLYVVVAYAQTIGFGIDARGTASFAASAAPLGALALRYANGSLAIVVSAGAAISAFAATLASATAAARLIFALATQGRIARSLADVADATGTPNRAFLATLVVATIAVIAFGALRQSGTDAFAACGSIATLALIIVYGAVQIAALRLFSERWNRWQRLIPMFALVALGVTFVANVVPVPSGAAASYPYVAIAWLALGAYVVRTGATA